MGNCCCCFSKSNETRKYKEGYSKVEGADFDYQVNQGLTRYGHMIKDSLGDVTSIHRKLDDKTDSFGSSKSGKFDTQKLLTDSLDESYRTKTGRKSPPEDSLENSGHNSSKSTEYLTPCVTSKSGSPPLSTSLFDVNYLDPQSGPSQITQMTAQTTAAAANQRILPSDEHNSQSKTTKPIRVKSTVHSISSEEDEEKSHLENVVKELGADQFTYIKRNGRKVVVIKDRGGTSFLFLGKNRHK